MVRNTIAQHEFSPDGMCIHCGVAKNFVEDFGTKCASTRENDQLAQEPEFGGEQGQNEYKHPPNLFAVGAFAASCWIRRSKFWDKLSEAQQRAIRNEHTELRRLLVCRTSGNQVGNLEGNPPSNVLRKVLQDALGEIGNQDELVHHASQLTIIWLDVVDELSGKEDLPKVEELIFADRPFVPIKVSILQHEYAELFHKYNLSQKDFLEESQDLSMRILFIPFAVAGVLLGFFEFDLVTAGSIALATLCCIAFYASLNRRTKAVKRKLDDLRRRVDEKGYSISFDGESIEKQ